MKNRVARFLGGQAIEWDTVELPPLRPSEVRLRVDVCALCGSDTRLFHSGASVVPGHEIAGTVVETSVPDVASGLRVVVYIPVFCRSCEACRNGWENRCENAGQLIGWQRDGGYAEFVDVPAHLVIPVPDDLPLDVAVLALDTVGTSGHGLRMALRTQESLPSRVAVVGCGPVGLGCVVAALDAGVAEVHAYDPNPTRLDMAVRLGAVPAPEPEAERAYEVVLEASGAAGAREMSQRLVRAGGAVLALGDSEEPYAMPATPRWRRTDCFTVRSFYFPVTDVERNWELLRRMGYQLRDQIVTTHPGDDLQQTFERFVAGELVKPLITMVGESSRASGRLQLR